MQPRGSTRPRACGRSAAVDDGAGKGEDHHGPAQHEGRDRCRQPPDGAHVREEVEDGKAGGECPEGDGRDVATAPAGIVVAPCSLRLTPLGLLGPRPPSGAPPVDSPPGPPLLCARRRHALRLGPRPLRPGGAGVSHAEPGRTRRPTPDRTGSRLARTDASPRWFAPATSIQSRRRLIRAKETTSPGVADCRSGNCGRAVRLAGDRHRRRRPQCFDTRAHAACTSDDGHDACTHDAGARRSGRARDDDAGRCHGPDAPDDDGLVRALTAPSSGTGRCRRRVGSTRPRRPRAQEVLR